MAKKISELTPDTTLSGSEVFPLAQDGVTASASLDSIKAFITKDLQQNIGTSTNPVVFSKQYPVSGDITKGQGVTLVNEGGTLKMKAITNEIITRQVSAGKWKVRIPLASITEQDDSNQNKIAFRGKSYYTPLSSQLIKELGSADKYYLCFHAHVRLYDSYAVESATNKPRVPSRVYSESITGSAVEAIVIVPLTVDRSDGSVDMGDFFYYRPQTFTKVKSSTANTELFGHGDPFENFTVTSLGSGKLCIQFLTNSRVYYKSSPSAMLNTSRTSGKTTQIFPERYFGNPNGAQSRSEMHHAIINPNNNTQWFAEYDDYYSNFFTTSQAIGASFSQVQSGPVAAINSTTIVSGYRGIPAASGAFAFRDDDGRSRTQFNYVGDLLGIYNITEGTETVGGATLNTFTIRKSKVVFANEGVFRDTSCLWSLYFRGSFRFDKGNNMYVLNSSATDFVRNFNTTSKTFTNTAEFPEIYSLGFVYRADPLGDVNRVYPVNGKKSTLNNFQNGRVEYYDSFSYPANTGRIQARHYRSSGFDVNFHEIDSAAVVSTSSVATDSFRGLFSSKVPDEPGLYHAYFENGASGFGFYVEDLEGSAYEREDLTFDSLFGVAGATYSDGDDGLLFFIKGSTVLDLYSGLVAGRTYYLSVSGTLTSNSTDATSGLPNKYLGRAISATEIAVRI